MPAKKPTALIPNSHESNQNKSARAAAEVAFTPDRKIPKAPPPRLKGHSTASALWRELVTLYDSIDGQIITAFDAPLLEKYCLLEEECDWLEGLRSEHVKILDDLRKDVVKPKNKNPDQWKLYINLLTQYNITQARVKDLDARRDAKIRVIHSLAQSLYLTPRSRAGVAPGEKQQEDPVDELEKLLSN